MLHFRPQPLWYNFRADPDGAPSRSDPADHGGRVQAGYAGWGAAGAGGRACTVSLPGAPVDAAHALPHTAPGTARSQPATWKHKQFHHHSDQRCANKTGRSAFVSLGGRNGV